VLGNASPAALSQPREDHGKSEHPRPPPHVLAPDPPAPPHVNRQECQGDQQPGAGDTDGIEDLLKGSADAWPARAVQPVDGAIEQQRDTEAQRAEDDEGNDPPRRVRSMARVP
jgi:hypothetical protein